MTARCGRRLEPLIFHGAEERKAAYAAYHRGGRRIHVGMQEFGEDMGAAAAAVSSAAGKAVSSTFTLGGLLSRAKPVEAKEPDDASTSGIRAFKSSCSIQRRLYCPFLSSALETQMSLHYMMII